MTASPANKMAATDIMPAMRRGECPTLAQPMQTGDGLLARLRPLDNSLTPAQLGAIAEAAARLGNGIIEITARGSLQIRGLRADTVADFERAIVDADIAIATGVGVETPPLAGCDPDELVDMRPFAAELRRRIMASEPTLVLAPKLAIVLDGGGRFNLSGVAADVRATALSRDGRIVFAVAVNGSHETARTIALVDEAGLVDTLIELLATLSRTGPMARGRDIDMPAVDVPAVRLLRPPMIGVHQVGMHDDARAVLGLAFAYCQADSASLMALAEQLERSAVAEVRLAPEHGLLVPNLSLREARRLHRLSTTFGFWTDPNDPRRRISLCAGSCGCASAFYDTHRLAEQILAHAPAMMDGSCDIHLSGCAKGCAHPATAPLTLAGARAGYGLVVNGAASSPPSVYVADNDIEAALKRLQALLQQSKQAGEAVSACLQRLGGVRIAAALQTDRT